MKQQHVIGIDVSDTSIKVLELDRDANITAYGKGTLAAGVVLRGEIVDGEAFAYTLGNILKNTQPKVLAGEGIVLRASLCLPESKLFTHYVEIPKTVKESDIETYVCASAQKIVPFELSELYWDYHVMARDGAKSATFVGTPKKYLDNYVEVFTRAGVRPTLISGQLFSLGSALLPDALYNEDYFIIDIGANTTTIGLFGTDAVAHASSTIPVGGKHLTQILAEKLALPLNDAEELKRKYGLNPESEHPQASEALRECIGGIVKKIIEAKVYFEKKMGNPIEHIILTGGSALMPGVADFISAQVGITATIANPLAKVMGDEVLEKDTPGIFFANVIGLARYGVRKNKPYINLLTQYRYSDGSGEKEKIRIRDIQSIGDVYYVLYTVTHALRTALAPRIQKYFSVSPKVVLGIITLAGALAFFVWAVLSYT